MDKNTSTRTCQCCYNAKPKKDFDFVHLENRLKYFCKDCYTKYPDGVRKARQVKYVFDIIKGLDEVKEIND
jgi:hypothetical protein